MGILLPARETPQRDMVEDDIVGVEGKLDVGNWLGGGQNGSMDSVQDRLFTRVDVPLLRYDIELWHNVNKSCAYTTSTHLLIIHHRSHISILRFDAVNLIHCNARNASAFNGSVDFDEQSWKRQVALLLSQMEIGAIALNVP